MGDEVYEHLKGNFPKMEVAVQVKVGISFFLEQSSSLNLFVFFQNGV